MANADTQFNRIRWGSGDPGDGGGYDDPASGNAQFFEKELTSPNAFSTEFNNLLTTMAANDVTVGGCIYIAPPRSPIYSYVCVDLIDLGDFPGITVKGDRGTVIELPSDASNGTVFRIIDGDNVTIENLNFLYSPTAANSNGKQFISVVQNTATDLGGSNNALITGCVFEGGGTCTANSNFYAVHVTAASPALFAFNPVIQGNTFIYSHAEQLVAYSPAENASDGVNITHGMVGIRVANARQFHIDNNTFRTADKSSPSWAGGGIHAEVGEFSTISNNSFYGLKCYTTASGVTAQYSPAAGDTANPVNLLYKIPDAEGGHITMTGNYMEQCGGEFVWEFRGAVYGTFVGNGIGRCSGASGVIGVTPSFTGVWGEALVFASNDIHNPNYLPGTTGFAIFYTSSTRGILINNNVFSLLGDGSGSQSPIEILHIESPCGHVHLGGDNLTVWKGY